MDEPGKKKQRGWKTTDWEWRKGKKTKQRRKRKKRKGKRKRDEKWGDEWNRFPSFFQHFLHSSTGEHDEKSGFQCYFFAFHSRFFHCCLIRFIFRFSFFIIVLFFIRNIVCFFLIIKHALFPSFSFRCWCSWWYCLFFFFFFFFFFFGCFSSPFSFFIWSDGSSGSWWHFYCVLFSFVSSSFGFNSTTASAKWSVGRTLWNIFIRRLSSFFFFFFLLLLWFQFEYRFHSFLFLFPFFFSLRELSVLECNQCWSRYNCCLFYCSCFSYAFTSSTKLSSSVSTDWYFYW